MSAAADDNADDDDVLGEYLAVVAKVDAAVAAAFTSAADAVVCAKGCDSCCAPGLSVLPVEAERIARFLEDNAMVGVGRRGDRCAFLDDDGACAIYAARPLLCRTHGLPLRSAAPSAAPSAGGSAAPRGRGALAIVDDVSVCALNFQQRSPVAAEVLDADRILALLTTVDRRFRVAAALPDDGQRVPLRSLAEDSE